MHFASTKYYSGKAPKKKMSARLKAAKKAFPDALYKHMGIIEPALKEVGITRATFNKWYRENAKFKTKCDYVREAIVDFTESKLMKAVVKEEEWAIKYHLNAKGKYRGYGDSKEVAAISQSVLNTPNDDKIVEHAIERALRARTQPDNLDLEDVTPTNESEIINGNG